MIRTNSSSSPDLGLIYPRHFFSPQNFWGLSVEPGTTYAKFSPQKFWGLVDLGYYNLLLGFLHGRWDIFAAYSVIITALFSRRISANGHSPTPRIL